MSTEIRTVVPRSALRPRPFNPRKTFDPAGLQELADSFGTHGILQPLLVRPIGDKVKWDPKKGVSGYDHFEVVCGHRRLAAAELGSVPELPVTIRALTDQEAREIQLIENMAREGVPPSEEAAAVRELVALVGLEKAAGRTGLPLARVRDLVRLASLPAWFLAAVDRGDVPVSTAAIVAKVPGEHSREQAAACVALGVWSPDMLGHHRQAAGGVEAAETFEHPLSSRDAKELIRTHFSRQLKAVPFSRKALDLVPEAGSCDACPKRAGNDPELMQEGVRADVCTDPDCCDRKIAAYREQELAKAAKKHGATPADDVSWERWQEHPKGWCVLDQPVGRTELNDPRNPWRGKKAEQTVAELLGSATFAGGKHVAFDPKTGKPVLLVRTKDARRALEAAGLLDKPERVKREATAAANVKREAVAHAEDDDGPFLLYRVTINPAALPAVEFDALNGTSEEDLREQAASAFMDWFDTVDWTAPGPQLLAYERVPEAEAGVLKPAACRVCGCTEADCRQCIAKTGTPCHWVEPDLCSACVPAAKVEQPAAGESQAEPAPALDAIDEPGEIEQPEVRTPAPAPGPVVCAPVGSARLRDVPKFPGVVAGILESVGVETLSDLDRRADACKKQHRELSPHNLLRTVEAEFGISFKFNELMAAGDALVDHLVVKPAPEPKAKKKGKVKA